MLPATSVALKLNRVLPRASGRLAKLNWPPASAMVLSVVAAKRSCTAWLASLLPRSVTLLAVVLLSPAAPVSKAGSSRNAVKAGAELSSTKLTLAAADRLLPPSRARRLSW